MNNNVISIIVGVVITLMIALYAGVSVADGTTTPIIIIGFILSLIGLIALKDKVWVLLFMSIVVTVRAPGFVEKFLPFELALAAVIPFYLFNVFFKKATLTWNKNKYLDTLVTVFGILVIALMIRYPFGILALYSAGSDYVNSAAYIHIIFALIFYITASTINTNSAVLQKVMVAIVFTSLLSALLTIVQGDAAEVVSAENITQGRFVLFAKLGYWLVLFCMCRYSIFDMVKKPWFALMVAVGLAGVALSGFRNQLGTLFFIFIFVNIVKKKYFDLISAPVLAIGMLIFVSFAFGISKLPFGIQRSISFIPYIEVSKEAKADSEGSTDWRLDMWRWAMDERKGYIQDRTWGDGFAQDKKEFTRLNLERAMGGDTREEFAARGLWHSGPISTIHRMGFVGLAIVFAIMFGTTYYSYLTCKIYAPRKYGWAVLFVVAPVAVNMFSWTILVGDINNFYGYIIAIPIVKLLLNRAKIEGFYVKHSSKEKYIPMMIQKDMMSQ